LKFEKEIEHPPIEINTKNGEKKIAVMMIIRQHQ
ncbi:MAG: hypothetical protein PWP67_2883, partial [Clostridium butyricum]|nr:hypothetical protein [Clostridium butyricum]